MNESRFSFSGNFVTFSNVGQSYRGIFCHGYSGSDVFFTAAVLIHNGSEVLELLDLFHLFSIGCDVDSVSFFSSGHWFCFLDV